MPHRLKNAFTRAAPIGVVVAIMFVFIALSHWPQVTTDPRSSALTFIGLTLVVFLTYFCLGLAGYVVRPDGFVKVPRQIAWYVVTVVTISIMGTLFYLFLGR